MQAIRPDNHSQRFLREYKLTPDDKNWRYCVPCLGPTTQFGHHAIVSENNEILCLQYMYLYDIIYMDLCVYVLSNARMSPVYT